MHPPTRALAAIESAHFRTLATAKIFQPPAVDPEQVRKIFHSVVIGTAGAKALPAQLSVAYPARQGNRTAVEITILVPRSQLVVKEVGGTKLYSLDVIGEVLKDERLFENYRYRFDYPADVKSDQIAVVLDRFLQPAEYQARVKVADLEWNERSDRRADDQVPEIGECFEDDAGRDQRQNRIARARDPHPAARRRTAQRHAAHRDRSSNGKGIARVEF